MCFCKLVEILEQTLTVFHLSCLVMKKWKWLKWSVSSINMCDQKEYSVFHPNALSRIQHSRHLLFKIQQWKHQYNMWNLITGHNKDIRTTSKPKKHQPQIVFYKIPYYTNKSGIFFNASKIYANITNANTWKRKPKWLILINAN